MDFDYDYILKTILVGDTGVGKSCMLTRYTDGEYHSDYISTIGVDFRIKSVERNGKSIKLQIWDTAGQERFRAITASYYRGAHCVVLVFDLTSIDTFNHLETWYHEVEQVTGRHRTSYLLVGNKFDLESVVPQKEISEFCIKYEMPYMEVSARSGYNIPEVFDTMVEKTLDIIPMEHRQQPISSKTTTLFQIHQGRKCC